MNRLKKILIFLGDVMILYGALALTLFIRYLGEGFKEKFITHFIPFTIIFLFWILVLYLFNFYQYKTGSKKELLKDIFLATLVSGFLSVTAFYLLPNLFELTPKINLALFALIFLGLKYGWQRIVSEYISLSGTEKILVLGNSPLIKKTVKHVKENPQTGYKVAEWIKDTKEIEFAKIAALIKEKDIHTVVIRNYLTKQSQATALIYSLLAYKVNVINFWNFYEDVFEKVPLEELEEGWFINNVTAHQPMYDRIKRITDIIFSVAAIIIFSPLLILSGVLVGITSKGPIIYKGKRMGKDTKPFTLYKFRSMYENHNGPSWTKPGDKRVTPVGKILRASHLDELPQLINILKGDISTIGPRPEQMELAQKFSKLPYYDMRHIIKPGLTGWAQINYRPSVSLKEAEEKFCYDIYYIKNRSFPLDFVIVLKTIRYFFTSNRN